MTKRTKIVVWIIILAVAVTAFVIWNSQRDQKPKTAEEIQREIDRLQNLKRQIEEDIKKAESGDVACILIYQPVCGKDGRTYSNDCFASAAGTEVAHQGACE